MGVQWVCYKRMLRRVLGLQAVVKSMLDDVIGGQHAQTEQLSNILGSSVLTFNKSSESSSTTHSTPTPHRDIDMEALENLVENLQRNGTHETTYSSLNSSHALSSTPQTTQSQTPRENHRHPNRFFAKRRGSGLHAELRGVRTVWCRYLRYMRGCPHLESRMY